MSGRIFTISFDSVAVSVAQDLFALQPPADHMIELISARIGQSDIEGDANAEMLPITIGRAAVIGSGGSTPVPRPHNAGAAAATGVYHANDDTPAASQTVVLADCWNLQGGWLYVPTPEERIWLSTVTTADILTINSGAPLASTTMSGSLTFNLHD